MRVKQSPRVIIGNEPIIFELLYRMKKNVCKLDTECYQLFLEYILLSLISFCIGDT